MYCSKAAQIFFHANKLSWIKITKQDKLYSDVTALLIAEALLLSHSGSFNSCKVASTLLKFYRCVLKGY